MNEKQGSPLARNVGGFANALSAICTLLILPQITRYLRPEINSYLSGEFSGDWALWGSWGFVVLAGVCTYFGITALLQMIVQMLFHRSVRKGGF